MLEQRREAVVKSGSGLVSGGKKGFEFGEERKSGVNESGWFP